MNTDAAIDFIMENRRGKAFARWTREALEDYLPYAAHEKRLTWVGDENGNIVGILLCVPHPEARTLHITECLTTTRGALKAMLQKYREWYDGWTLTANRRGQLKEYRTPRLVSLLEATT